MIQEPEIKRWLEDAEAGMDENEFQGHRRLSVAPRQRPLP